MNNQGGADDTARGGGGRRAARTSIKISRGLELPREGPPHAGGAAIQTHVKRRYGVDREVEGGLHWAGGTDLQRDANCDSMLLMSGHRRKLTQ